MHILMVTLDLSILGFTIDSEEDVRIVKIVEIGYIHERPSDKTGRKSAGLVRLLEGSRAEISDGRCCPLDRWIQDAPQGCHKVLLVCECECTERSQESDNAPNGADTLAECTNRGFIFWRNTRSYIPSPVEKPRRNLSKLKALPYV
jgi:hypothetical protein